MLPYYLPLVLILLYRIRYIGGALLTLYMICPKGIRIVLCVVNLSKYYPVDNTLELRGIKGIELCRILTISRYEYVPAGIYEYGVRSNECQILK